MKVGLPPRLIGAGARGCPRESGPRVRIVAPHDHVAQSVTPGPVLFWRYDAAPGVAVDEVTIVRSGAGLADTARLVVPRTSGVQRVRLSEVGGALRPSVEYTIQVRVRRAGRTVAGDTVALRLAGGASTIVRHVGEDAVDAARRLAGRGVWYDAYALLADSATAAPRDETVAALRDALEREAERVAHVAPACDVGT